MYCSPTCYFSPTIMCENFHFSTCKSNFFFFTVAELQNRYAIIRVAVSPLTWLFPSFVLI